MRNGSARDIPCSTLSETNNDMKRIKSLALALSAVLSVSAVYAETTVKVQETRIPILIERYDNVLFRLKISADEGGRLDRVALQLGPECDASHIHSLKLYYGGTESRTRDHRGVFEPAEYIASNDPGNTLKANPAFSILKCEVRNPGRTVTFNPGMTLFPGVNYLWVSVRMKNKAKLSDKISAAITSVRIDGVEAAVEKVSPDGIVHRMGVGVRHAGDDGSKAFRIPGLVTSNAGTLVAVYDIRYESSRDLQGHIDIGVSRSRDGGRTWEKMRRAISYGEYGGLPAAQNGAGDPAILVDNVTGDLIIASIWAHGMGNGLSWWSTVPGISPDYTAQLVLSRSSDDGKTWSAPVSVTPQLKDSSWAFFFQGPGRGITTSDGTLVFATQYTEFDAGRTPHAGIMYSKDHGKTWNIHKAAKDSTTEAQVAELPDGSLMLNMRDNRGGARSVAVTRDLGRTWEEHPSSRKALIEPVCMASLISVRAEDNVTGKDLLLFSNPESTRSRNRMTIKASLDGGLTWSPEHSVLLDEGTGWGYSCLSMIDGETVGILYESSVAHMTFQAIPLKDIIKE